MNYKIKKIIHYLGYKFKFIRLWYHDKTGGMYIWDFEYHQKDNLPNPFDWQKYNFGENE